MIARSPIVRAASGGGPGMVREEMGLVKREEKEGRDGGGNGEGGGGYEGREEEEDGGERWCWVAVAMQWEGGVF